MHFPYDKNTDKNELPDDIVFGDSTAMKKFLIILLSVCTLLTQGLTGYGQKVPASPILRDWLNDLANAMTPDQEATLEAKLKAYDDSTTNQIVIVTVPSTDGSPIEDYALQILREWASVIRRIITGS